MWELREGYVGMAAPDQSKCMSLGAKLYKLDGTCPTVSALVSRHQSLVGYSSVFAYYGLSFAVTFRSADVISKFGVSVAPIKAQLRVVLENGYLAFTAMPQDELIQTEVNLTYSMGLETNASGKLSLKVKAEPVPTQPLVEAGGEVSAGTRDKEQTLLSEKVTLDHSRVRLFGLYCAEPGWDIFRWMGYTALIDTRCLLVVAEKKGALPLPLRGTATLEAHFRWLLPGQSYVKAIPKKGRELLEEVSRVSPDAFLVPRAYRRDLHTQFSFATSGM